MIHIDLKFNLFFLKNFYRLLPFIFLNNDRIHPNYIEDNIKKMFLFEYLIKRLKF